MANGLIVIPLISKKLTPGFGQLGTTGIYSFKFIGFKDRKIDSLLASICFEVQSGYR